MVNQFQQVQAGQSVHVPMVQAEGIMGLRLLFLTKLGYKLFQVVGVQARQAPPPQAPSRPIS
ncbi:hypothetical protein DPMN_088035 [Dreissena polymorpha]|uniref:Uncharacterized protein n=1 Tax=Dreissena polymorpha TaxID=45954 RepID=A0A9D4KUB6_DREPO|nr:hypothetical protein DPMN_088035 [Dreissena polymorpha]